MQVQQISFKNNINQPTQKIGSGSIAFSASADKFESSNKKDNTRKFILAGLGVIAAIVAIIKRKQIGEFFSKLFKGGEKTGENLEPPKQKPPLKEEPPVIPPKPKFELPKPEFKYTEVNPIEFAKEKDVYIAGIIPHSYKNEDIALQIMEQFDKYGSSNHLMNLATSLSISENKTDKMVQDFLKLYKKFGLLEQPPEFDEDCDATLLRFILQEFETVISKDTVKKILTEFKRTGKEPGDLTDVRSFLSSKEQNPFLRKFSDEELNEIRQYAQDAEEIVRKRVYKD